MSWSGSGQWPVSSHSFTSGRGQEGSSGKGSSRSFSAVPVTVEKPKRTLKACRDRNLTS